ncbi:MAG TPA: hypothetical protein VK179_19320 [Bacteroidales bacterium]|nr:hypothetical protein [Bacteroidales bacterium]
MVSNKTLFLVILRLSLCSFSVWSQNVNNITWANNRDDSISFNCYCQGSRSIKYTSKIFFKPINDEEICYRRMYIGTYAQPYPNKYNIIRYSNDTLYIMDGGIKTSFSSKNNQEKIFLIFSERSKTIRSLNTSTTLCNNIQFITKNYIKEFHDSINIYKLYYISNIGLSLWYLGVGKYAGIVFYAYYDGNLNHFCIKDFRNKKREPNLIKKFLKYSDDPLVIKLFSKRGKFPSYRYFKTSGRTKLTHL